MKTTTITKYLLGTLLTLTSGLSLAGQEGHGGGVHYCPGAQVEVEFYDLYEAREVWDKVIPTYDGLSVDKIIEFGLKKIRRNNYKLVEPIRKEIKNVYTMIKLKPNQNLIRVEDANILMTNKNCTYEQMANWHDPSKKIFVDQTLYEKLAQNNLGMAAFILHEAAYKVSRDLVKADNSNDVRKYVGEVFSNSEIETEIGITYGLNLKNGDGNIPTVLNMRGYMEFHAVFRSRECIQGQYLEITALNDNVSMDSTLLRRGESRIVPSPYKEFSISSDKKGDYEARIDLKSSTCGESYPLEMKNYGSLFAKFP